MSPQQLRGMEATVADDLYSLGATLYELLTGQPPFKSTQPAVLMHLVLHELPLPINKRRAKLGQPPVPDVWEKTIQALLAKEPKDRPGSAGEVARRLSS
jgi:serine/threonine protein kinase